MARDRPETDLSKIDPKGGSYVGISQKRRHHVDGADRDGRRCCGRILRINLKPTRGAPAPRVLV